MEKDQNINNQNISSQDDGLNNSSEDLNKKSEPLDKDEKKLEEKSPEEKIFDLEDKLARTFAEMENQRRRFEKEKDDAYEYGGFTFAKEALNVIDNLERSKQILKNDETIKNSEALKKILEHLDIINKDIISIFSKNNIQPIDSLNKKLDPNFHQAMIEIEDDHKEPGTIIQEIQKGFIMKDRLLRPALVGVSKKSENKGKKADKNDENIEHK